MDPRLEEGKLGLNFSISSSWGKVLNRAQPVFPFLILLANGYASCLEQMQKQKITGDVFIVKFTHVQ